MLDMVHLSVYSAHVCLLCQLRKHCLNLLVYVINLILIAYYSKGVSCLNLLENLDILGWKTYRKKSWLKTPL